jgi:hypothetical protein
MPSTCILKYGVSVTNFVSAFIPEGKCRDSAAQIIQDALSLMPAQGISFLTSRSFHQVSTEQMIDGGRAVEILHYRYVFRVNHSCRTELNGISLDIRVWRKETNKSGAFDYTLHSVRVV